jgi:hypothetical protein
VLGVTAPCDIKEPPGHEPCLGTLTDRLEQPVAHLRGGRFGQHQRAVDQGREAVQHILTGPKDLGRVEVESASEHRQLLEQQPLGGLEQLVAPVEGCLHRALTRAGVADTAAQQGQSGVQPIQDLRRRQHPAPRGGQLDGQR